MRTETRLYNKKIGFQRYLNQLSKISQSKAFL